MPVLVAGEQFDLVKGPVTTTQLVMYAGASGDFNRIHYDLPFAQEARLGGVIAHGMLIMGFAAQLLTDWGGTDCFVREISARFLAPVRPGDTVCLHGVVSSVAEQGGRLAVAIAFRGTVDEREAIVGNGVVSVPG